MESLEKTKICTKCKGLPQPLTSYAKKKQSKDGYNQQCKACCKLYRKVYRHLNLDKVRSYAAAYKQKHPEKVVISSRIRYQRKREEILSHQKQFYIDNKDKIAIRNENYRKQNLAAANAKLAKYRCSLVMATPSWLTDADKAAILSIYQHSIQLTKDTGIPHEVDHIVPLQGKTVRGLHVPWNLQVLTKQHNRIKGRKI